MGVRSRSRADWRERERNVVRVMRSEKNERFETRPLKNELWALSNSAWMIVTHLAMWRVSWHTVRLDTFHWGFTRHNVYDRRQRRQNARPQRTKELGPPRVGYCCIINLTPPHSMTRSEFEKCRALQRYMSIDSHFCIENDSCRDFFLRKKIIMVF